MPATFVFDKSKPVQRMRRAVESTLSRVERDANAWWVVLSPVGEDRPNHKAGTLRNSWRAQIISTASGRALKFSANTSYAIYVELGTGKMQPRAPLRTTAGEVIPFVLGYLREEWQTA